LQEIIVRILLLSSAMGNLAEGAGDLQVNDVRVLPGKPKGNEGNELVV